MEQDFSKILNSAQKIGMTADDFTELWARIKYNGNMNSITPSEKNAINNYLSSGSSGKKIKNEESNTSKDSFSALDFSQKMLQAGERRSYIPSSKDTSADVSSIFDILTKKDEKTGDTKFRSLEEVGSKLIGSFEDKMVNYYQQQSGLLTIINEQAGLTGKFARYFREELTNANPRLEQLGIDFNELAEAAKSYIMSSGRFATINQQTWERAGEVAKAYVGTLGELVGMYPEFEKVGLGAADAQERIADAGKRSMFLGLQAQKTTKELSANLGRLNEYGFKNGVQGLAEMVRKSTELRMSMDSVFKIAEDVMDPDKALSLSANLQSIGGTIGAFNDPLKLMYMATNNVEGLQDALKDAASSLAVYNSEQGRFEITGINLRRAKAMASELGITYKELSQGAIAAAEKTKIQSELAARGLELSDDQKRFISNIAQMKGGKMTIELNSQELKNAFGKNEIAISELTREQLDKLTKLQDEFKDKTSEEIIRDQATDVENIKRDLNFMLALMMKETGQFSDALIKDLIGVFSNERISNKTLAMTKEARPAMENKGTEFYNSFAENIRSKINTIAKPNEPKTTQTQTQPNVIQAVRSPDQQSTTMNQNASATANLSANQVGKKVDVDITKYQDALVSTNIKTEANTLDTSKGVALLNKNMDTIVNYVQNPKVSPPNNNTPIAQVNVNANPQTKNIDDKSMANVDVVRKRESEPIIVDKKVTIKHEIYPISNIVDEVAKAMLRNPEFAKSIATNSREYINQG
jgi:hypothetical protein